jgi:hypothetical protein
MIINKDVHIIFKLRGRHVDPVWIIRHLRFLVDNLPGYPQETHKLSTSFPPESYGYSKAIQGNRKTSRSYPHKST